ncbi:MAG: putative rane protein [Herbinix sp.]|nr:putative rane protein [Herbinix sp.]
MNQIDKIRVRWKGYSDTVLRFSFAIIMLVAAAISNSFSINIQDNNNYMKFYITFVLGASIYIVFQLLYERFFEKPVTRISFMLVSAAFSIGYYLIIRKSNWEVEITIRTAVILFLIIIAFFWVPVIKSRINFNDSFMAAFKAFFISLLFTGVLFLGVCLVLGVTDMLIANIDGKSYLHAANIIFVLLTPIYFLSMIPIYPGKKELLVTETDRNSSQDRDLKQDRDIASDKVINKEKDVTQDRGILQDRELINQESEIKSQSDTVTMYQQVNQNEVLLKLITPARFLESLISYVIIPITAVFTIILLLYIILNITGSFWTDNLLEPLLVSYSIIVILVYLLASTLKNAFAKYFRKIFPKVLVIVVLFQTLSSVLRIEELGITYGRYYVILFGVFATIAGIIFSVLPTKKNGIIAPILMTLALLSIVPPIDAFTVSKANQIGRLEEVLRNNNMLVEDTIIANPNVPVNDRKIIINSIQYLNNLNTTVDVKWLSAYNNSLDFEGTFGFAEYDQTDENTTDIYLNRDNSLPLSIEGYDYLMSLNYYNQSSDLTVAAIEHGGKSYKLLLTNINDEKSVLILSDEDGNELIQFNINEIFNRFTTSGFNKTKIPNEEFTFSVDNVEASMKLVVNSISIIAWEEGKNQQVDLTILIKIKK